MTIILILGGHQVYAIEVSKAQPYRTCEPKSATQTFSKRQPPDGKTMPVAYLPIKKKQFGYQNRNSEFPPTQTFLQEKRCLHCTPTERRPAIASFIIWVSDRTFSPCRKEEERILIRMDVYKMLPPPFFFLLAISAFFLHSVAI